MTFLSGNISVMTFISLFKINAYIGRRRYTNSLWCCSEVTKQSDRWNWMLVGIIPNWFKYVCSKLNMKIVCWCWLTVGSSITFAFFLNKTFRWFKYVCNKRLACKISARFHSLTKMSRDHNNHDWKIPWPKQLRLNQPDRNFLFQFQSCYVSAKFK